MSRYWKFSHEGYTAFLTFSSDAQKRAALCDMYRDPAYSYIPDNILLPQYGLAE